MTRRDWILMANATVDYDSPARAVAANYTLRPAGVMAAPVTMSARLDLDNIIDRSGHGWLCWHS